MKKRKLVLPLMSILLLTACGEGDNNQSNNEESESKEVISLWANGSDNVRRAFESVAEKFNQSEYGQDYELEIQFITSGTGVQGLADRVLAAKNAGETETDYDLITLSDAQFTMYTEEGGDDFFKQLNSDLLSNDDKLTTEVSIGEEYLLPYRGTTVVLAYDSESVDSVPETSESLYQWIIDNPSRFAYNTPNSGGAGQSFVETSIYNFLPEEAMTSSDESWKEEWDQGFDLLKELHPYLYESGGEVVYPNKNQGTLDLLANKQVDMIPAWADMVIQQKTEGVLPESIEITQIDPALTGNLDAIAMPEVGGASEEGAHAVMDFFLSEDAQQILLDEMAAIPLIDSENMESPNAEMLENLDTSEFRAISIGGLATDLQEIWEQEIASLTSSVEPVTE